jgi:hypothetical protein
MANPNLHQRSLLAGPPVERAKQALILMIKRLLAIPYRLLTLPIRELRGEVGSLRSAAVESIAYVGVELRRLGDLIEHGGSVQADPGSSAAVTSLIEAPFVFRSLAGLEPPASVLIAGASGGSLGTSLSSFGYEVTAIEQSIAEWDAGDRSFQAVLCMGDSSLNPTAIERIERLLAADGVLVISHRFGSGYDQGAISELLGGWNVAEQALVANREAGGWAPVTNGTAPERGVALLAARRTQQTS